MNSTRATPTVQILGGGVPLLASFLALTLPTMRACPDSPDPASTETPSSHLLGDLGGLRPALAKYGVDVAVEYTGEVMGNVAGGLARGTVYDGLLKAAVDVDLERLAAWRGARLHVSSLSPHGRSLSEHYSGDLFTLSNIDAPDDPRLFELWFEQTFGKDYFSVRAGVLAADEEFAFTEQGSLFINGTCGWPTILALNVPSPAFPQGALGVRAAWHPSDAWHLQVALYDGDPNPLDADGQPSNPHGVTYALNEGALILAECGYKWHQGSDAAHPPGLCKLGVWYHTAEFNHLYRDDLGFALADPSSSGQPGQLSGNWGCYLTVEQILWREPKRETDSAEGLGAFMRLGAAPADRNPAQFYAEGGLTYVGLFPGREADALGLAVVYGQLSDQLRALARAANQFSGSATPLPDFEMVVELTYRFELRPGWSLQPGLECIIHPGGSPARDPAWVLGIRTHFDF
ncbi:MAG: carbohydrate porin [Verrucomicrobiota bacterium]